MSKIFSTILQRYSKKVPKHNSPEYPRYFYFEKGSCGFVRKTIATQIIHSGLISTGAAITGALTTSLAFVSPETTIIYLSAVPILIGSGMVWSSWNKLINCDNFSQYAGRGYVVIQNKPKRLAAFGIVSVGMGLAMGASIIAPGGAIFLGLHYILPMSAAVICTIPENFKEGMYKLPYYYAASGLLVSLVTGFNPVSMAFITAMTFVTKRTVANSLWAYTHDWPDHLRVGMKSLYVPGKYI